MTAREEMLGRIRAALGRKSEDPIPAAPVVRLSDAQADDPVLRFTFALSALGGKVIQVTTEKDAESLIGAAVAGKRIAASCAPLLGRMGIAQECSREACVEAEIGLTSADYALADTGSLVFLSESGESRLISLLPPRHIAVIERAKILPSLDAFLAVVPQPSRQSSALVLVTGPSRTADIEMRLVRGVHGPGEITVIVIG
jgi:L-lactate utilization protein LutC